MECRDAQFYLRLRRHAADELGPDVGGALDAHLAACPACAADARAAAAFDRAVARAMRAVPVPADLREKLVTQAAAHRGAVLRRNLYRGGAVCAAALVLLGLGLGVYSHTRPKPDTDGIVNGTDEMLSQPDVSLRMFLHAQELPPQLPYRFNPALLAFQGRVDVQGRSVPMVQFRSPLPNDNGFARVYIFRQGGPFDVRGVPDAQASFTRADVVVGQGDSSGFTYVVVYTGQRLDPFLLTPDAV
jgi:hypothetical protein